MFLSHSDYIGPLCLRVGRVCCPQFSALVSICLLLFVLQDYTTLKREYRVHFVKVPTGDVVNEMVSAWWKGSRRECGRKGAKRLQVNELSTIYCWPVCVCR